MIVEPLHLSIIREKETIDKMYGIDLALTFSANYIPRLIPGEV